MHRLGFVPDGAVYDGGVGLDEFEDFCGDVCVGVVWDGEAVVVVGVECDGEVDGLEQGLGVYAGEDEAAFVEGFGSLGGCADADGGEGVAD